MAIVQLLEADAGEVTSPQAAFTQSVAMPAGTNRLLLVCVAGLATVPASVNFPTVTYGGVPLSLVYDGAVAAAAGQTSTNGVERVFPSYWMLREADFPAGSVNDLVATWNSAGVWQFTVAWMVLNGAAQPASMAVFPSFSQNVADVKVALTNSAVATSLAATMDGGLASDAVIAAAITKRQVASQLDISIGGVGITEDFDVQMFTRQGRAAGGKVVAAGTTGTVAVGAAFNAQANQAGVLLGIRLQAATIPVAGSCAVSATKRGSVEVTVV